MTYNSMSEIFQKISRTNDYNLKILSAFTRAMISDDDSVTVELLDSQNNIQIYTIPAFGYFKKIVNNLSISTTNVKNTNILSSVNDVKAIESVEKPKNFIAERNKTLDYFYNKSLYVTINLTNKISTFSEYLYYEKIILNVKEEQQSYWNTLISTTNVISYDTIFDLLKLNSIEYYIEKDVKNLNPTVSKYNSSFDVYKAIKTEYNSEFKDYVTVTTYSLNTIEYIENIGNNKSVPKNLVLNDTLVTRNNLNSYKVLKIEKQSNGEYYVTLGLIDGVEDLEIVDAALQVKHATLNEKFLNIPIKVNEKIIVFLKNIDENYVMSSKFSNGIVIDVNKLETIDENQNLISLTNYEKNIYNFANVFTNLEKNNPITTDIGIKPDYPIIKNENFSVNRINKHINVTDKNALENLIKQLVPIDSRIQLLQQFIADKNVQILQQPPLNPELITQLKHEIVNHYIEINSKFKEKNDIEIAISSYNSTFTEISNKKPKYRVRGFWNLPEPKKDSIGNLQEVIQFKISYRYLSTSGQPNPNLQYSYYGLNGEARIGYYSEWNEFKTDIRKKTLNTTTNKYEWIPEDTESDIPNINQLDLAINPDERIEIRIKSISEAGWPENPIESDWSNVIIVDFPEVLKAEDVEIQNLFSVINDIKLTRELKALISTTNSTIETLIDKITTLNTEVVNLKQRVTELENN